MGSASAVSSASTRSRTRPSGIPWHSIVAVERAFESGIPRARPSGCREKARCTRSRGDLLGRCCGAGAAVTGRQWVAVPAPGPGRSRLRRAGRPEESALRTDSAQRMRSRFLPRAASRRFGTACTEVSATRSITSTGRGNRGAAKECRGRCRSSRPLRARYTSSHAHHRRAGRSAPGRGWPASKQQCRTGRPSRRRQAAGIPGDASLLPHPPEHGICPGNGGRPPFVGHRQVARGFEGPAPWRHPGGAVDHWEAGVIRRIPLQHSPGR